MRPQKYMFRGEERTVQEIAAMTGLSGTTLYNRLREHGGDAEAAVQASKPMPRRLHMWQGEKLSITEISRRTGVKISTLQVRMTRCGMDAETAVKAIRSGRGSKYMYRGERKTLEQIAVISGVSMEKLYRRIHEHGASADEAADPNYCGLRYTLYGEKVSLQMAARHCAIPIREIRARLAAEGNPTALDDVISALREERRNKRPETAPAQECEEKPKPQGVARARDMLGNLFPPNVVRDEMRTVQEGRLYRISRDFLDYEARLDERGEARLIVLDRNTGRVWFDRSF